MFKGGPRPFFYLKCIVIALRAATLSLKFKKGERSHMLSFSSAPLPLYVYLSGGLALCFAKVITA
jgi:hypothetical protein